VITLHKRRLSKPDGRALWLYGRSPIDESIVAPGPREGAGPEALGGAPPARPNPHLRFHPLRGEWVAYASHRQTRTFLPPPDWNPLAPSHDPAAPTEVPAGAWDVAVFENRFPTLTGLAHDPPPSIVETRPARGACEVVVFTQDASASLASLPTWHLELLVAVWADRTRELGARDDVQYVMPFENRGVEVGVTLHHPHGQIYAYPFVPPIPAREIAQQRAHYEAHGRGLLEDLLGVELGERTRLVHEEARAVAWVPAFARYAYEVWVAPKRPAPTFVELDHAERADLAATLKVVLSKLDALWARPMPYVLAFHQAPTDGALHPEAHLHAEIYPAYRMPGRLKYLAGSEIGAGAFTADTLPEAKAAELRAVHVPEGGAAAGRATARRGGGEP
jgi:UDPglucose--hexose-1-phosphate uridylyltransferase